MECGNILISSNNIGMDFIFKLVVLVKSLIQCGIRVGHHGIHGSKKKKLGSDTMMINVSIGA